MSVDTASALVLLVLLFPLANRRRVEQLAQPRRGALRERQAAVGAEEDAKVLPRVDDAPALRLVGGELEVVRTQPGDRLVDVGELVPATRELGAVDEILDERQAAGGRFSLRCRVVHGRKSSAIVTAVHT